MRLIICAILYIPVLVFSQYQAHSYDETVALADSLLVQHPAIIEKHSYGTSVQGRELFAVKISDNVGANEAEPEIGIDAGCHGIEIVGQEMAILLMKDLCTLYGTDTQITRLVNTREIWIYPHVNPDARENLWEHNNANNVGTNRDFGYMWGGQESSPFPFSQPETKACGRWFLENHFAISQSTHDGLSMITYPWGNRPAQVKDRPAHNSLASAYASRISAGYPFGSDYETMYQVTGMTSDFFYGSRGTLAFTVEVSGACTDTQNCPSYYAKHKQGMLYFIEQAGHGIRGTVTDASTGRPVSASIWVTRDTVESFPVYNDPVVGDYHKVVLPGTYSITASANGYEAVTKTNVIVSDTGALQIDFELTPSANANRYGFEIVICRVAGLVGAAASFQDEAMTPWALGKPDGRNYSLGQDGYVVIDMGDTLYDRPGPDLRIIEGDASMEGYSVRVGLDAFSALAGWQTIGKDSGSASFDLADSGVAMFRYVCVRDDNDDVDRYADNAGFDLDAVVAIRTPDTTNPSVPALLIALPVDDKTVRIAWSRSTDSESGIARYLVYRDNVFIAQTADTAFIDTGLSDNTLYTYAVEAVNSMGCLSGKSNTLQVTTGTDAMKPTLVSVCTWYGPSRMSLLYSEPVEEASSEDPSNYSLTGGLAVDSAALSADNKTVYFKLAGSMIENGSYTLTVSNVRDRARAPNAIVPNSQISFIYSGVPDSIGFIQAGTACDADISVWRALRLIIPSDKSGVVQSVAFRHIATSGQIRYGVYANSGNVPGICMDSTDWQDVSPGWQRIDLINKNFIVRGGDTIWISVRASAASAVLCYSNSGTGTHARSISNSSGSGLPTPWVSTDVAYTDYCGYAVIQSSGTTPFESGILAGKSPADYRIQAAPNPFNPALCITYQLPRAENVELCIFDSRGRKAADLVNSRKQAGTYQIRWDASRMASGLYFARLKTDKSVIHKRLALVR